MMVKTWVTLVVLLAVMGCAKTLASLPMHLPAPPARTSLGRNNVNDASAPVRADLTGDPNNWIVESDENGGTLYLRGLGFAGAPVDWLALGRKLGTLCKPMTPLTIFLCKLADAPPAEFAYLFTQTPHTMIGEEARSNGRELLGPRELNEEARSNGRELLGPRELNVKAKEKDAKEKEADAAKVKAHSIEVERQRRNTAEPKWFISGERLADFHWKTGSLSSVSGLFGGKEKVFAKAGRELIAGSGELKYHCMHGCNALKAITYDSSMKYARVMGQYGEKSFKNVQKGAATFRYSFIKLSACRLEKAHGAASESSLCSVKKRVLACIRDPGFIDTTIAASAHNKKHNIQVKSGDWTGFNEAKTRLQRACTQDELNDVAMHA